MLGQICDIIRTLRKVGVTPHRIKSKLRAKRQTSHRVRQLYWTDKVASRKPHKHTTSLQQVSPKDCQTTGGGITPVHHCDKTKPRRGDRSPTTHSVSPLRGSCFIIIICAGVHTPACVLPSPSWT